MTLGFGITFADLYDREGLQRVDTAFLNFLREANDGLYARLLAARGNFAQDPPGEARIVAGGHVLAGTGHIKQVMGDASPLGRRRLCGSDVHLAVERDGIATHNFAAELLGKRHRQGSLAARGGAKHDQQEGRRSSLRLGHVSGRSN